VHPDWQAFGDDWAANAQTVVVGVDGSGRDRSALRWAAADAARGGTDLLLVTVVDDGALVSPRASMLAWRSCAEAVLDETAALVGDSLPRDDVHRLVLSGDPATCLARRFTDVRLLVVGRRGVNALERVVLGSTSLGLVARSSVPVVVVPDDWEVGSNSRGPVVVAVTEQAGGQLALAAVRAARLGVPLVALHAGKSGHAAFERQMDQWQESHDLEVKRLHIVGQVGDAILQAASDAQLVVTGRSPHPLFPRVLSSTLRAVLHYADCPVMVVPDRADDTSGGDEDEQSG
jgi:nucleotide-binding universal stress UspA family protein